MPIYRLSVAHLASMDATPNPCAESSNQRAALVQVLRGGACAGETWTYHATSFQTGEKKKKTFLLIVVILI